MIISFVNNRLNMEGYEREEPWREYQKGLKKSTGKVNQDQSYSVE